MNHQTALRTALGKNCFLCLGCREVRIIFLNYITITRGHSTGHPLRRGEENNNQERERAEENEDSQEELLTDEKGNMRGRQENQVEQREDKSICRKNMIREDNRDGKKE